MNNIVKTSHSNSPIKYSTLPHAATTHIKQDKQQQQQQNQQKKILHQCHSISDIANETKQRYGSIDTGNLCDVCKKTKFTYSGAGNICFYCKLRCCVRCAFKYTTKNKVSLILFSTSFFFKFIFKIIIIIISKYGHVQNAKRNKTFYSNQINGSIMKIVI